jgi:NAD(P)-dependent dehydrogenase (short-subunit alcohol dehydrogenase family)
MDLTGRTVLVTGAGRGIGRSIALALAEEGAAVALAGRSADELSDVMRHIRSAGGRADVVLADVRDQSSTEQMVTAAESTVGPVDLLVANSGVGGPTAPLWEVPVDEWDETHAVNVRGTFLCCRAVLPGMVTRGAGGIVVIGSMSGKRPLLHRTAYTSSKTALVGLVRTLASEVGPFGVRVNLVSPGPVAGPRLDGVLEGQATATGRPVQAVRDDFLAEAPLRRILQPEDVARAVVFLASDDSRGITGEDLNVSAGLTMH